MAIQKEVVWTTGTRPVGTMDGAVPDQNSPKPLDSGPKFPYEPPIRGTGVSDRTAARPRRLPFRYQPRPGDGAKRPAKESPL